MRIKSSLLLVAMIAIVGCGNSTDGAVTTTMTNAIITVRGYKIEPNANLVGAVLLQLNLANVDLSGADLTGADLQGSILTGANLANTELRDAILTGANLTGAILLRANLKGANLTQTDLTGANLRDAILTGANLGTDWHEVLSHTDLPVELSFADLTGADLRDANFSGANLNNANLTTNGIYVKLSIEKTHGSTSQYHEPSSASIKKFHCRSTCRRIGVYRATIAPLAKETN